jgi:hypothetical protein
VAAAVADNAQIAGFCTETGASPTGAIAAHANFGS